MTLPKSKYEILCAIVAQMKNAPSGLVKAEPLAKACGYSLDIVIQNFGFFSNVGIVSAGMNKYLSEDGFMLSHSLCTGDSDQVITCWRTIVDRWPTMLRLLSWIRGREGIEKSLVMAEPLFLREASSSRFALDCLIQVAHRLGYIYFVEENVFVSDYAEGLFESNIPSSIANNVRNFSGTEKKLSVVLEDDSTEGANREHGEGIHIHLHLGAEVSPAQIESIFKSLSESVLSPPGVERATGKPLERMSIRAINQTT
jgi:alpha-glucuronidase